MTTDTAPDAPEPKAPAPLPIASAPRDGTMLRLLVDYRGENTGNHALEDALIAWTFGSNGFDLHGIDEWQFVGWDWSQDVFIDARQPTHGTVIGWLPLDKGDKWMVIGTDSFDRDSVADFVICRDCHSQETAVHIAELMNNATADNAPTFYVAVKGDHKLKHGMFDLV